MLSAPVPDFHLFLSILLLGLTDPLVSETGVPCGSWQETHGA